MPHRHTIHTPPRVLIIEDESIVAADLHDRLVHLGYDVPETAAHAQQGIQQCIALRPDIVLMNIALGGSNEGIHAATQIRRRLGIPTIFITSYVDEKTLNNTRIAEPYGFLLKPIRNPDLRSTIEVALSKQAMVRRLADSQNKILQVQKMDAVGHLAGGLAHAFNNILTEILQSADLILTRLSADDVNRQDLQTIRGSTEQASRLVRQLVTFSRQEITASESIDLVSFTHSITPLMENLMGERIRVHTRFPNGSHLPIRADPRQLEQLFLNLVFFAHESMNTGRWTLSLETAELHAGEAQSLFLPQSGPYAEIRVTHEGLRLTSEENEHFFDPFYSTTYQLKKGGLGMAAVYGMIRQNRGAVHMNNDHPDGMQLTIHWPLQPHDHAERSPRSSPLIPMPALTDTIRTLLLVENEDRLRTLMERILVARGYRVIVANSGEQALQAITEHSGPIDLLISDVVMPGMNGRELAELYLQSHPRSRVLFMSGHNDDYVLRQGISKRQLDFLQKPFGIDELIHKLHTLFPTPQGTTHPADASSDAAASI